MAASTGQTEIWHPVPRTLIGDTRPPTDLFVEFPSGFTLYFAPAFMSWGDALTRIEEKSINVFWVRHSDFAALQKHIAANLKLLAKDETIPPAERGRVLYHACYQAISETFAHPDDVETFLHAKVTSLATIESVLDHPEILPGIGLLMGHDYDTFSHSVQVASLTVGLAQRLRAADREEMLRIGLGAMFHDIGKARVPAAILQKPGPLSAPEWRMVQRHPFWGDQLLTSFDTGGIAPEPVLQHHERYDGAGYPHGLRGEQIALSARITKVADVFNAVTSTRVYRDPMNAFAALSLMKREMLGHFDPAILDHFIQMLGEVREAPTFTGPVGPRVRGVA